MALLYVDWFETTLAADVAASASLATGTITLTSVATLPVITTANGHHTYLVMEDSSNNREEVKVTDINTGTKVCTVVRDSNGYNSAGLAFTAADVVRMRITKSFFDDAINIPSLTFGVTGTGTKVVTITCNKSNAHRINWWLEDSGGATPTGQPTLTVPSGTQQVEGVVYSDDTAKTVTVTITHVGTKTWEFYAECAGEVYRQQLVFA